MKKDEMKDSSFWETHFNKKLNKTDDIFLFQEVTKYFPLVDGDK